MEQFMAIFPWLRDTRAFLLLSTYPLDSDLTNGQLYPSSKRLTQSKFATCQSQKYWEETFTNDTQYKTATLCVPVW